MALLEELSSGHYQPTPIQGDYKLCDFLYKEPFFGQMYAKQLPGNWTCPFPPVSKTKIYTKPSIQSVNHHNEFMYYVQSSAFEN